jgi:hypothetical protein
MDKFYMTDKELLLAMDTLKHISFSITY